MAIYDGTSGVDSFPGTSGDDQFNFTVANLSALDLVTGGAGTDTLRFSDTGTIAVSVLAQVTGIERITLVSGGSNSLTLNDAVLNANTSDALRTLRIVGGNGNDLVDASSVTLATRGLLTATGGGIDTLLGGAGADIFTFTRAGLNSLDIVNGGLGANILRFTDAGLIDANAFKQVSNIQTIALAGLAGQSNSVTLKNFIVNLNTSATSTTLTLQGSAANDMIDGSDVTYTNRQIAIIAGTGNDTLIGGSGDDSVTFSVAGLTAADIVNGGGGINTLRFTDAGTIGAAKLTQVTNAQIIALGGGGGQANTLTLTDAILTANTNATTTQLHVITGNANDTIDGSALTLANRGIMVTGSGGIDIIRGGAGADIVLFSVNDLTSADLVNGGGGVNTLRLSGGGAINLSKLSQVSNMQVIELLTASGLTLNNGIVNANTSATSTVLTVRGSAANDVIDASAVSLTARSLAITGGAGADTITGGAGADSIDAGAGDDFVTYAANDVSTAGGAQEVFGLGDTLILKSGATVDLRAADQVTGGGLTSGFESVDASASSAAVTIRGSNSPIAPGAASGWLIGGSAGDTIRAGDAAAIIIGGLGVDSLFGGAGGDGFIYNNAAEFSASETIDGGDGYDQITANATMSFLGSGIVNVEQLTAFDGSTITLSAANAANLTVGGRYYNGATETFVVNLASGETADLSGFAMVTTDQGADAGDAVTINGAGGAETVILSGGVQSFNGGTGNDVIRAGDFSTYGNGSTILGEGGNDSIGYGGSGNAAIIDGGADADTLTSTSDKSYTGLSAINLSVAAGTDQTVGDSATVRNFENIDWSGGNAITITGSAAVNSLIGSGSADTINAGGGADFIRGGGGGDTLNGGSGNDDFFWATHAEGGDMIVNFAPGADGFAFTSAAFDFNGAAFDSRVAASGGNLAAVDLLIWTGAALADSAAVRTMLNANGTGANNEGLFVVATDGGGRTILYHSASAGAGGADPVVYEIADLGTGVTPAQIMLGDFLFL